jgi:2-iminobutanoate/2-iminopropanoate deaminase
MNPLLSRARRVPRLSIGLLIVGCAIALDLGARFSAQEQEKIPLNTLPFSPARQAGPTLYVSGQVARTAAGTDVRDSVAAETKQVMENIGKILRENGYSFDDVVNVTVYLKDLADYQEMNKAYAAYFPKGFPARATVGGVDLVFDFRVEISCIAWKE